MRTIRASRGLAAMNDLAFLNLAKVYVRAQRSAELSKDDFLRLLVTECYHGRLRVTGFPCAVTWSFERHDLVVTGIAGRGREEINAPAWVDLVASFSWGGCASFGNADILTTIEGNRASDLETALWTDLSFDQREVEKIWPKPKVQATANGKRGCAEWLEQLRRDCPTQPKSKDELQDEARVTFGVGPRQFQDAWTAAAAAAPNNGWGRAGRRGKS
jgi:hypothetical protein